MHAFVIYISVRVCDCVGLFICSLSVLQLVHSAVYGPCSLLMLLHLQAVTARRLHQRVVRPPALPALRVPMPSEDALATVACLHI